MEMIINSTLLATENLKKNRNVPKTEQKKLIYFFR